MNGGKMQQDIDRIKTIIAEKNQRYQSRGGDVRFAGIEGNTVRISPTGFCWR